MSKIKLDLREKNVAEKIAEGLVIAPLMQADPNAQIQAHGNAIAIETGQLNTKNVARTQAKDLAKSKTQELNTEENTFDNVLRSASAESMIQYPNNKTKWEALGWLVSDDGQPIPPPAQVESVSVTIGDFAGQADMHWDSQKIAMGYKIQQTETEPTAPGTVWAPSTPDFSTKSKITITALVTGRRYWFRVIAVNAAGAGAPSDPISKIIS